MDLAALGVHHDGDGESLLVIEPPDGADGVPVPLPVPVAHVEAGHVHPADGERLELVGRRGCGPHGADELGAARAPEPVLPQLRLRGGVHVDGRVRVGREDPGRARRRERGEVGRGGRGGGAEAEGQAVRAPSAETDEERSGRGRLGERRAGGGGGRPAGRRYVQEGAGGGGGGGHGDGGGGEMGVEGRCGAVGWGRWQNFF